MTLLLHDPVAHRLIVGAAVTVAVGEIVATFLGKTRAGANVRGSRPVVRQDRGTRLFVALAADLGFAAAIAIARVPGLRFYANNWWTLGFGVAVVLTGAALRDWAILTLGRYFRRSVTIESEQRIVRHGPYRVLRHPSYTGLLLIFAGFGLMLGSWVGAAVALLVVSAGLLPRIRVEERALTRAFGPEYADYAHSTARLLPHVW